MGNQEKLAENPYTNAKNSYRDNVDKEKSNTRMWQIAFCGSLFFSFIFSGAYIYERNQSKFIPYIVEVNELGQSVVSQILERAAPVDARIIKATLAQFISDLRTITPDTMLQKNAIQRVYSFLAPDGQAIRKTTDFYSNETTNPFKKAEKTLVTVNILSVLPQTEQSWQVTWLEKEYDRKGVELAVTRRTAILQLVVREPTSSTTEEEIRQNPLGIFISNYDLSEELQ